VAFYFESLLHGKWQVMVLGTWGWKCPVRKHDAGRGFI